jgi:hypothetical protein
MNATVTKSLVATHGRKGGSQRRGSSDLLVDALRQRD